VQWVRRWRYELRWEPGHRGGVLSRDVDTVTQLRAVVEWARANPNVTKCAYRPVDHLEGEPAGRCPDGHRLGIPDPRQPYRLRTDVRRWACRACPGHDVTTCPSCGRLVIEPPPGHGCAAVDPRRAAGNAGATG
jgi:hypothetical protein